MNKNSTAFGAPGKTKTGNAIEMWTFAHQLQRIAQGKTLRIITDQAATSHWSCDGLATANDTETRDPGIGCWFVDLPSKNFPAGASIVFTVRWPEGWAGEDFQVVIAESKPTKNIL